MKGRMRDFPKRLLIGESEWKVVWKRKIVDDGILCAGLCDSKKKTIFLQIGQTPKERVSTFFHEMLHALEFEHGIALPHETIYRLEGPLAELFRQNAWVQWAHWMDVG